MNMDRKDNVQESPSQTRSMLVVADADLDAKLFDHLLKQEWNVDYVVSNDEALQTLWQRPFDLIVTVGVMAHVDSPDEFLRKIKTLLRP